MYQVQFPARTPALQGRELFTFCLIKLKFELPTYVRIIVLNAVTDRLQVFLWFLMISADFQ